MGGRAAEEVFLNHMTTGAGNDIQRATELARKMVCEWGMSEELGPLTFGQKEEQIFLGKEFARHRDYSEQTAMSIDREIHGMVADHYEKAKKIIEDNKDVVERIAEALLERETLDAREIETLIEGRKLPDLVEPPQPPQDKDRPIVEVSLDDGKVIVGGTPATPGPEKV